MNNKDNQTKIGNIRVSRKISLLMLTVDIAGFDS